VGSPPSMELRARSPRPAPGPLLLLAALLLRPSLC
jgi:hypothetical protein